MAGPTVRACWRARFLDPLRDRRPLLGGAAMFGVDVGLLLDGGRGEVAQGGSPGRGDLRDLGGDGLFGAAASELAREIGDVFVVVDVVVQPVVAGGGAVVELVGEPAAGHRDVAPFAVGLPTRRGGGGRAGGSSCCPGGGRALRSPVRERDRGSVAARPDRAGPLRRGAAPARAGASDRLRLTALGGVGRGPHRA
jgi:hypothetical protein